MNHVTSYPVTDSIKQLLYRVYAWMMIALAITAGVAYYIFSNPTIFAMVFGRPYVTFIILMAQLFLVIALSVWILRMSYLTAAITFICYALLMGVTFSAIFYTYSLSSIYSSFAITAGMFGTTAVYGYFTKSDLSQVGSYARMALFGLIIALIVNMFWQNNTFDFVISLIGVAVFTALTAWDMQRLVQIGHQLQGRQEPMNKIAIVGALSLYLDFINLFLMMLRLFGNRRN
jgi:FtsH-binding integral membrane protein